MCSLQCLMKYKTFLLFLSLSALLSLSASTCFHPREYEGLAKISKTVVSGTVKIEGNRYFILVDKSWFPIAKKIEILPMTKEKEEYANDALAYGLELRENDWIFVMTVDDSKEKIYIPGCGDRVDTLSRSSKDFYTVKAKLEKEIVKKITKVLGPPKYHPNRK